MLNKHSIIVTINAPIANLSLLTNSSMHSRLEPYRYVHYVQFVHLLLKLLAVIMYWLLTTRIHVCWVSLIVYRYLLFTVPRVYYFINLTYMFYIILTILALPRRYNSMFWNVQVGQYGRMAGNLYFLFCYLFRTEHFILFWYHVLVQCNAQLSSMIW